MIKAIFYSKFDTLEGPKVVHQIPDGAIVPSPTAPDQRRLFSFPDVSFFVIPRQELCGNLLQVCTGGYRILGHPICMKSPRYDRNEFIFNFCIVLAEEEDFSIYKSVVQKLADLMHGLEEQNGFLSRDFSKSGQGKVHSLCETLMEDLNNYCECMIPIDELNTLNIKLFPLYPPPPQVKAWHVPLFTVRYEAFMDENWDLTMQRIVPHINGINSIKTISTLADADFSLTCRAIRHLLYYGCLFLLDIFSFTAIYAPTAQFGSTIACDEEMQRECALYVNTRFAPLPLGLVNSPAASRGEGSRSSRQPPSFTRDNIWPEIGVAGTESTGPGPGGNSTETKEVVDGVGIVELYAGLKQGQSVKQWYADHSASLANIDLRRFITFGIIKGFLYRVHKYPYATGEPNPNAASHARSANSIRAGPSGTVTPTSHHRSSSINLSTGGSGHLIDAQSHPHHDDDAYSGSGSGVMSGSGTGLSTSHPDDDDDEHEFVDDRTLAKFLDGNHCFDQICTELEVSEKYLTARLKKYHGEVLVIHR